MSSNHTKTSLSRRGFLKRTAAAAGMASAFPYIIPASALGLGGAVAPSNRITIGFIGVGTMNKGHVGAFLDDRSVQVLALCDISTPCLESQSARVNAAYAKDKESGTYKGCDTYKDFREICARPDIDGMVIATPDHWHVLNSLEAVRNGKDVYCEKPLTRFINEGKVLVNAVRRYGRVFQVGSMQRSDSAFLQACELVRNGRIGKLKIVHVNVGGPPKEDYLAAEPVPEGLDWDMWLGPCPWRPYSSVLAPPEPYGHFPAWREYRPYGGNGMCDFGAHHYDIAQWSLDMDGSGPVKVLHPADHPGLERLTYEYANGLQMTHGGGHPTAAVEWIGTDGWIRANRGFIETSPASLRTDTFGPGEIRLYKSNNHKNDWLDAMRLRKDPICTVEIGHRTATVCHIGNIAYRLNRSLQWDPVKEEFVNDPDANRLLQIPMRAPWSLS